MKTQDNRATSDPIFVVYDYQILSADPDYVDDWEYADIEDGYTSIGTTKEDLLKYAKSHEMDLPENIENLDADDLFKKLNDSTGNQWIKTHYQKVKQFKGVFFTEKAAQDFIDANNYHFNEPHIYVHSLWRNYEMQAIRAALLDGRFIEKQDPETKPDPK